LKLISAAAICSAVVGRNGPFSPHLTPPRLRTGESMHLVCFWPSPTSMARRERQRRASAVQWWVRTVRTEGWFISMHADKTTPFSPHSTPPRLRTGQSMHLVCFWPSPTSMARRERQRRASAVQWWVRTVRAEGWFISMHADKTTPFSLHLTPPRLRTGESINT
jgi:hypothetical protein